MYAENLVRNKARVKWYLRPVSIVIAILAVGPLAIPLVWMSPALKAWQKVLITALLIIFTLWFIKVSADLYQLFAKQMRELEATLGY